MKYTSVESLDSYLSVIKSLQKEELDEEYYDLMMSAKELLGDVDPRMAKYYYQYGHYLLLRIERNGQLFGNFKPQKQPDQNQQEQDSNSNEPTQVLQNGNVAFKDKDVTILNGEDSQNKQQQQLAQQPTNKKQHNINHNQDDDTDLCYQNLSTSLSIYQKQYQAHLNEQNILEKEELNQLLINIAKVKLRIGDFYYIEQEFDEAIRSYRQSYQLKSELCLNSQTDRTLAQIHFLIGNTFLLKAGTNCEQDAIVELIQAVNILVANLKQLTEFQDYDLPTKAKLKIDRLNYLPKFSDNDNVKELKEVINCILDKLEDVECQMNERQQVERLKKTEEAKTIQTQFQSVATNVPIINLGTFGNANTLIKRKAPPASQQKHTQKKCNPE